MPFIVVLVINGVLWLANWGTNTSLVMRVDHVGIGKYYLNPRTDYAYVGSDMRGPEPRAFALPKPPDTFRIIVVGASSVQGYPYPSELSFPRHIQLLLEHVLGEELQVEVLNAGIVGMSSLPLVDVVRQLPDAQPNAVVVYAGHNEFYGVGGVSTNASINAIGITARKQRLFQVIAETITASEPPSGQLISQLPKEIEIPAGSGKFKLAEQRYHANLSSISNICAHHGISLLLCSVVSNLRDQGPLPVASASYRQLQPLTQVEWDSLSDDERSLLSTRLRSITQQEPTNALAHYRLAQLLERTGKRSEAVDEYSLARDYDVCRYRAPSSFRHIAERVAADDPNTHFVDLAPVFNTQAENAAPGLDLFVEHVHFSTAGNWLVAKVVAKSLVKDVLGRDWSDQKIPTIAERDKRLGILNEDHISARTLAYMLSSSPPFDRAVDVELFRSATDARIAVLLKSMSSDEIDVYRSVDNKSKVDDLVDGLGRVRLSKGEVDQAMQLFELGAQRRPWMPNSLVFYALCLDMLNRRSDARAALEESRRATMVATPPIEDLRDELSERLGLVSD